jgi:DNA-binding NarL/FixJ family response regulator
MRSDFEAAAMIRLVIGSDYPVMRAGVRTVLGGVPECQVVGEVALAGLVSLALDLRPDVVVLELRAQDHEGLETISRMAAELPEVAILVLSWQAGDAFALECLHAGARGYLLRDVSPEEMVEAVRAMHQGLAVLHPAALQALLPRTRRMGPAAEADLLSERETEVLQLLAQGLPSKTIAARLNISEHTVKFHVGSILGKLGAASRTEAVSLALRRGLISL